MGLSMKVHQFTRGFWEHSHEPSLTLAGAVCKRLRPLAPKLANTDSTHLTLTNNNNNIIQPPSSFDLKSFIRPDSGPIKQVSTDIKRDTTQVETHPGGTRWNPTQEQIGILEMLYRGGMRTPNSQQIEQITAQLGKYGKIEGKNVFYWFQNHKARERQKQKRNNLGLAQSPRTPPAATKHIILNPREMLMEREEESLNKRKCRSWSFESLEDDKSTFDCKEEDEENKTLELFPLHPEGILSRSP